MEAIKNFKKIDSYGASSGFPVYGGRIYNSVKSRPATIGCEICNYN